MDTLTALETVIERHGRAALSDPIAMTGALRSLPDPPPDADIAALAAASGAGAIERMRAVLDGGGGPTDARRAGIAAVGAGPRAEWACDTLGAALGMLPRDPDPTARVDAPTAIVPTAIVPGATRTGKRRRRRLIVALGAVVALGAAGGGVAVALSSSASPTHGKPVASGRHTPRPTTSHTSTPAALPADPHSVFKYPDLLKFAEPYVSLPGMQCHEEDPGVGADEEVSCSVRNGGWVLNFSKVLNPAQLVGQRNYFLSHQKNAVPGSIRILRWEYVPGQPGVRRGIPFVTEGQGNGTRIRWLFTDANRASLYFDEDATGDSALVVSATSTDPEILRGFWQNAQ